MSLTLRTAVVSDPGMVRTNNEDSAHAGERLLAVADGVGGMPAGELASDIVIRVQADPATEGMGTTITALLLLRDQTGADTGMMALLHVGDSRAYLLRGGELRQLTKDDTFVQSLVDQGLITADEARNHPQRSLITRAVQGQHVAPTTRMLPVQAGDRYLLCSDGLSDVVTDEAIGQAMQSYPDLRQCAEQLVKLALQAGAPDNVTAVLADVRAADD
jgi:protein phosphatase